MNIIKNPSRLTVPTKVVDKQRVEPLPSAEPEPLSEKILPVKPLINSIQAQNVAILPTLNEPLASQPEKTQNILSKPENIKPPLPPEVCPPEPPVIGTPAKPTLSDPPVPAMTEPPAPPIIRRQSMESKGDSDSEGELHIDMGSQEGWS